VLPYIKANSSRPSLSDSHCSPWTWRLERASLVDGKHFLANDTFKMQCTTALFYRTAKLREGGAWDTMEDRIKPSP